MRQSVAATSIILLACATLPARTQTVEPSQKSPGTVKVARTAYFIDPMLLDLTP